MPLSPGLLLMFHDVALFIKIYFESNVFQVKTVCFLVEQTDLNMIINGCQNIFFHIIQIEISLLLH